MTRRMEWVDSHAHLDDPRFDQDRADVIQRARDRGVAAILNIGVDVASSRAAIRLAQEYDFIYATVGVHPHDAKTVTPAVLNQLRALAQHPRVVAIGEIGLDYYRDRSPRPVQRRVFARQLDLAAELNLPVVVHSRDAHDDVLAILRDWEGGGVFHSYAAGPEGLDAVLELGFSVSIAGPVTFPKAHSLRAVAASVPLDRLLVETDCPYLTPVPHRGRRNEPAYTQYVVEAISQARGVTPKEVAQATTDNFCRVFAVS